LAAALALVHSGAHAQSIRGGTRLDIVAGSTAEYRVREQLARLNFPNDAVGTTDTLSGGLTVAADGSITSSAPLTVDLRDVRSDSGRRDAFLRENTLHSDRFPRASFTPRRQQGLPLPLPSSGKAAFTLTGDMSIHGVTSELAWDVTAVFSPTEVAGEARTRFPFKKFGLEIPRVMGLLSVDDDIRLVLTFKAKRTGTSSASPSTK
jgi:polyisoprenoid-binding protein YceI